MSASERGTRGETVARQRDEIDRGLARDKVPAEDPAAAPLGTDSEAAGAPPSAAAVAEDRRARAGGRADAPDAIAAGGPPASHRSPLLWAVLVVAIAAVAAVTVASL